MHTVMRSLLLFSEQAGNNSVHIVTSQIDLCHHPKLVRTAVLAQSPVRQNRSSEHKVRSIPKRHSGARETLGLTSRGRS